MAEIQEEYSVKGEQLEAQIQIPEAPGSLNIRFSTKHGFEAQYTHRSFSEHPGADLIGKLADIEKALMKAGCKPIFGKNGPVPNQVQKPQSEDDPLQKPCPIHGVMMDRRESKQGGYFYSHPLGKGPDGKTIWCNGKEK